ncbi:MAG: HPF/RaiA family ribosome-associated protein [Burkholderiaceae bacterium]
MQVPLQITFRHMDHSDALESNIREWAERMDKVFPNLTSCRVVLEEESSHKHQGNRYIVHLDVHAPGHEFAVNRHRDEDPYVAVRDAFNAALRKLDDLSRQMRGDVKTHSPTLSGEVARLNADDGYGFIVTPDGRELYFAAENLVNTAFDSLAPGTFVHFIEEVAAEGFQAKRVSVPG